MGNNNNNADDDGDIGPKRYLLMPRRHSSGAFEMSPNNEKGKSINNHHYYYHRSRRDSSPRRITAFYPITAATNIHTNYNHFGNHNRTLFINDLVNRRQSMPLMMNNSVSYCILFPLPFFSSLLFFNLLLY